MRTQTNGGPARLWPGRIGALVTTLVSAVMLVSASAKFAHVPAVVGQLAADGIADHRLLLVAVLEALSAALFLVDGTRSAGLLLVSAFLGGAIATHLQHAHSIAPPAIFLGLTWFGAWMRNPEIVSGWRRARSAAQREEPR